MSCNFGLYSSKSHSHNYFEKNKPIFHNRNAVLLSFLAVSVVITRKNFSI